jgi:hypothetical protein
VTSAAAASIQQQYEVGLAERRAALAARERTHAHYSYLRLVVFGTAVAILVVGGFAHANWLLVPLGAFIVLAIGHARLLNARDRASSAVAFYERGLARIAHDWVGKGRDGADLLERLGRASESHLYAADLDVFGRGSLFELLATTRTQAGEETLAAWLLAPAAPEVIRPRQAAVRELATRLDLRERVAVMGDQVRVGVHASLLRSWSRTPIQLRGGPIRVAIAALVAATVATLVWFVGTDSLGWLLLLLALAQVTVAAWLKPRVLPVIEAVEEPAHDLDLLAGLLKTIEDESFRSAHLQALQASVRSSGQQASVEIARLSRLVAMLASRGNVMFAIPAGVMLWATQWAFAIEAWRARAGVHIPEWLDAVGEFEALLALAAFSAEHPDYVFPEIADAPGTRATLAARSVAHPLLPDRAVANTVELGGAAATRLLIVSGSNMSGKSTLLRALGVNVVLAQMGAPVRAAALTLSPLAVGAAIRVQDSLTDGKSRFFAEITRLKAIVDLATQRQGAVLFLLDEILSGTNSHDRRIGAEALLTGLVRSGAIGLVTTHDLALGEIATRLTGDADNAHFEDQFTDGRMTFDYTLRPGIVRTSNAIAWMRDIGLEI